MASYNKNFVVKNGIEVADNLIFATSDTNRVGIGTTLPTKTLDVNGDIRLDDLEANDIFINNSTINGSISAGSTTGKLDQVLYSTGTGVTWSSIPIGVSSISFSGNGSFVGVSSIVNFIGTGITYSTSGIGVSYIFNYNPSDINPYIIYVSDFGAVGDGIVDDTLAIQSAISSAADTEIPCIIRLLEKHKISSTLTVIGSNVTIEGAGSDIDHDTGSQGTNAKTQLIWNGVANETMMLFTSILGASNQKKSGGGVRNIYFDANDIAGYGLRIRSWDRGVFENLHFNNPKIFAISMNVVSSLGEARDNQYNRFINCSSRHWETTGGTGGLLECGGITSSSNTSFNHFELLKTKIKNGDGIVLNNCDGNYFSRCVIYRLNPGTGNAVVCNGSDDPEDHARTNVFVNLSATEPNTFTPVPIVCKGTSSFTYPSENNNFFLLDVENATPLPTIETGATAYYSTHDGYTSKTSFSNLAIGATFGDAGYSLTSIGSTQSLYISNRTSNHIVFDNRNSSKWIMGADSNGKFTVTPSNTNNPIIFNSNVGIDTSNPTSKLHIIGNARISGIVTAASFSGSFTGGTASVTQLNVSGISTFNNIIVSGVSTFNNNINVSGIITCASLTATSTITAQDVNSTSDINLKTNIETVENPIEILTQLRGVSFDWKASGKKSYGVIAQELEEVLPELVNSGENKSVNYNGLIAVLIEAIKDLKTEIEDLKNTK